MYVLNRSAVVVKLKQPYLDWTISLPDSTDYTLESMNKENHVYLIQSYETDAQFERIIKSIHSNIFEAELDSWYRDRELWPEDRDYKMFKKWFEVIPHSMAIDTLEEDIEGEEF